MYRIIILILLCAFINIIALADNARYGVLNVFTDLPDAVILIDGLEAGKESVVKLALDVGEHYVQVKLDGKLVYAEKVQIQPNRSATVVSEHFVDIITNTPSRGAIDREAARLRESRGNFSIGVSNQSRTQPVASLKWWLHQHLGIQAMGLGEIPGTEYHGMFAGRILFSPADKIFNEDVLSGYLFAGNGRYWDSLYNMNEFLEAGIGVEANLSKIANFIYRLKYFQHDISKQDQAETDEDFLKDSIILGLLNFCLTSAEISIQTHNGGPLTTNLGVALHLYF